MSVITREEEICRKSFEYYWDYGLNRLCCQKWTRKEIEEYLKENYTKDQEVVDSLVGMLK